MKLKRCLFLVPLCLALFACSKSNDAKKKTNNTTTQQQGYNYTFTCNNPNVGITGGTFRKDYGDTIILSTTSHLGTTFDGWYLNNEFFSKEYSCQFEMPKKDVVAEARFTTDPRLSNFTFESTQNTCKITGVVNKSVRELTIPNLVTEIGEGALAGCSNLEKISIPFVGGSRNDVAREQSHSPFGHIFGIEEYDNSEIVCQVIDYGPNWGHYALFYIPKTLKEINVTDGYFIYDYAFSNIEVEKIVLPSSNVYIYHDAFNNCKSEVSWNNGTITEITKDAFHNFKGKAILPNSLETIEEYAFNEFLGTTLTIPNSVKTIKSHAFYESNNLVSITLGSGLEEIEVNAFSLCDNLVEVYNLSSLNIKKNGTDYGQVAISAYIVHNSLSEQSIIDDTDSNYVVCYYEGVAKLLVDKNEHTDHGGLGFEIVLPDSIKFHGTTINSYEIGYKLFYELSYLKKVILSDAVTKIGSYAFNYCGRLEEVVFANNLIEIGAGAFGACDELDNVVIPNSVTKIESGAFNGCDKLKTIVLPNSLTTLDDFVLSNCDNLVGIIIPDSVTTIKCFAHSNDNLEYIVLPVGTTFGGYYKSTFVKDCPKLETVYYRGTSNWDSENEIIKERLADATIYYYSETQPSTTGNYWHYDSTTNEPVIWNVE